MKKVKDYKTYKDYIEHQLEKTKKKETKERHNELRNQKILELITKFSLSYVPREERVLCIGSRYGEEVEALKKLGYENVDGIDLIDIPPYTKKMDMHDLKYNDNTFRFIYTNSLDHSLDPNKVISEIVRVSKLPAIIMIDLELYNYGNYEVYEFESINDIVDIFKNNNIKFKMHDISMLRSVSKFDSFYLDNSRRTLIFKLEKK